MFCHRNLHNEPCVGTRLYIYTAHQLHGSRGQRPELRYWIPNQSMGGVRDLSVSCISDTALLAQGWLYEPGLYGHLAPLYRPGSYPSIGRGRGDLIGASVTQSTPGEILAVLASSVLPGPVLRRTVLRPTVLRPSVLFPAQKVARTKICLDKNVHARGPSVQILSVFFVH